MRAGAILLGLVLLCGPAFAESLKAIDLARDCRSGATAPDSIQQARCTAYVAGFISGSQANFSGRFFNQWRYGDSQWCMDDAVSDPELIAAFLSYAQNNTGELHFPAATGLAKALAARYPCR